MKKWYTYITTNQKNWTLYTWVTNNLEKRIYQHKNKKFEWFTKKYNLTKLVYYEEYNNIADTINREKQLKWWNRNTKIKLIEEFNKNWEDLAAHLN